MPNEKIFKVTSDVELIKEVSRETLKKKHSEICDKIKDTYAKKNHDYGTVFEDTIHDYGLLAPVVRFRDKLGRIETLLQVKNKVEDESIKDTILDLANYCIMTYAVLSCIEDVKKDKNTLSNEYNSIDNHTQLQDITVNEINNND